jgi:hypothetical protein
VAAALALGLAEASMCGAAISLSAAMLDSAFRCLDSRSSGSRRGGLP